MVLLAGALVGFFGGYLLMTFSDALVQRSPGNSIAVPAPVVRRPATPFAERTPGVVSVEAPPSLPPAARNAGSPRPTAPFASHGGCEESI